jgi:hypothetical protein
MSAPARLTLLACALAAGSCSGCSSRPPGAGDAQRTDQPRPRPEQRQFDHMAPDGVPPGCSVSQRQLAPQPIAKGTPFACGPACEQVAFGYMLAYGVYEVAGDLLAYSGHELLANHVVMVNLARREESLVHRAPKGELGCMTVDSDGARLAYSCGTKSQGTFVFTLHTYEPSTRIETELHCLPIVAGKGTAPDFVALADTGVAAQISIGSDPAVDIYFYRFSDRTFTNLTKQYGGVWESNADIYMYDRATGKTVAVTTHPARQDNPDVWGDWVVWEDYRHDSNPTPSGQGLHEIYAKNVKTGEELRLTDTLAYKLPVERPRVDNGRAFFIGGDKVFMIDLAKHPRP